LVPCHRLIMGVSSLDFKPRFGGVFSLARPIRRQAIRYASADVALPNAALSLPQGLPFTGEIPQRTPTFEKLAGVACAESPMTKEATDA
jgi:hypothetical protein